jgi:hypothetical protein
MNIDADPSAETDRPAGGKPSDPAPRPQTAQDNFYKRQFDKAQKELADIKRAQLSETERLRADGETHSKRADAAEARFRQAQINAHIESEAARAGAKNPVTARKLADLEDFRVDDDGKVSGPTDRVISALKKEHDYLFPPQNAGSGGTARTAVGRTAGQRPQGSPSGDPAVDRRARINAHLLGGD